MSGGAGDNLVTAYGVPVQGSEEDGGDPNVTAVRGVAHPRHTEFGADLERMLHALDPYVVHAAAAPNFTVAPLVAAPDLQRAFDIEPHFTIESPAHQGGRPILSGYSLKIDGAMPLDSRERVEFVLPHWNTGLGTSAYKIEELPSELKGASNDDAIALLTQKARDSMPHLISPSHSVVVGRTTSTFGGDSYTLFVTANDVPAARRLYQYVARRAASKSPMTLEQLVKSNEYESVLRQSQKARNSIARQYAAAHGIRLAQPLEPYHTTLTHVITPASDLAHGAHKSLAMHRTRTSRFYIVRNDTADASMARDGMVAIHHGIMGGITMLLNPAGGPWQQAPFLSSLPTSSVEVYQGHTRATALHADDAHEYKQTLAARVVWHSDLGQKLAHSGAHQRYYSMSDPYTTRWLQQLGPYGSAPLTQKHYSLVTGQLPNISTLHATHDELARLARYSGTPTNIAVALDNPIVSRIPVLYDPVISVSKYAEKNNVTLAAIFRNVYEIEAPEGSFGRLFEHSALDEPDDESLYADAAQYGLVRATGCLAHSGTHAARQWLPVTDDELVFLVTQATGVSGPPKHRQRSAIALSKELLRLITIAPPKNNGPK